MNSKQVNTGGSNQQDRKQKRNGHLSRCTSNDEDIVLVVIQAGLPRIENLVIE